MFRPRPRQSGTAVPPASVSYTHLPPAAPSVHSAFLASLEVAAVADQSAVLMGQAAAGLSPLASASVWLGSSTLGLPGAGGTALSHSSASFVSPRGAASDSLLIPAAEGGAGALPGGRSPAPGAELLLCIEPRCREVVAECLSRIPLLLAIMDQKPSPPRPAPPPLRIATWNLFRSIKRF